MCSVVPAVKSDHFSQRGPGQAASPRHLTRGEREDRREHVTEHSQPSQPAQCLHCLCHLAALPGTRTWPCSHLPAQAAPTLSVFLISNFTTTQSSSTTGRSSDSHQLSHHHQHLQTSDTCRTEITPHTYKLGSILLKRRLKKRE